jgi:hypothetical protein
MSFKKEIRGKLCESEGKSVNEKLREMIRKELDLEGEDNG